MTIEQLIDELKRFDPHTECRIDGMEIDYIHLTQKDMKTIIDITHCRPRREVFSRSMNKHMVDS